MDKELRELKTFRYSELSRDSKLVADGNFRTQITEKVNDIAKVLVNSKSKGFLPTDNIKWSISEKVNGMSTIGNIDIFKYRGIDNHPILKSERLKSIIWDCVYCYIYSDSSSHYHEASMMVGVETYSMGSELEKMINKHGCPELGVPKTSNSQKEIDEVYDFLNTEVNKFLLMLEESIKHDAIEICREVYPVLVDEYKKYREIAFENCGKFRYFEDGTIAKECEGRD